MSSDIKNLGQEWKSAKGLANYGREGALARVVLGEIAGLQEYLLTL